MRRQMRAVRETAVRPANVCTPRYALKKARAGIKLTRWELEGIAGCPSHSLEYALHVVKGPWEPGEAAILRSSNASLSYALNVIGGRWEKGEDVIAGCAYSASSYAESVIGGRWEKGEAAILGEFECSLKYVKKCVGRWVVLEDKILDFVRRGRKWRWEGNTDLVEKYLKAVGVRWPGLEEVLMEKDRAKMTYMYAVLTGGRLSPALHQKMMMYGFDNKRAVWSKKYIRFLERCEERAVRYLKDLDTSSREELISRVRMD